MKFSEPIFRKGDCLKVRAEFLAEVAHYGFSIFCNDIYEAEDDSIVPKDSSIEVVELVENGDWEPCTFYDVRFFEKVNQEPHHACYTLENLYGKRTT